MRPDINKLQFFLLFSLCNLFICNSQVFINDLKLEYGNNHIGFPHYLGINSTRTYKRVMDYRGEVIFRDIPMSIWYSAIHMQVSDYILRKEEEWEYLPDGHNLNRFYPNKEENQNHLKEEVRAVFDANLPGRNFPTILDTPGYQASSIENFEKSRELNPANENAIKRLKVKINI